MKKHVGKVACSVAATIAAAIAAVSLASCGDVNVYDDDNGIITSNGSTSVMMNEVKIGKYSTISAQSFTGVKTLYSFSADNSITVSYDTELTSGRLKLVVCDNENVIVVFEGEDAATDKVIPLESGSYRLRLVGDNAEFSMSSFTYTVD